MEVRTTLRPGNKGTRALLRKYGKRLISVRYRYDRDKGMCYKTVELVEECWAWDPTLNYHPDRQVALRIHFSEETLRQAIKARGGKWDQKNKLWWLDWHSVVELSLESRLATKPPAG